MRVLIGCECSGVVRRAFRARGHDAWSCDLKPARDGSPWHIQGDLLKVLAQGWDLAIFHPPCTFLTNSAAWAFKDGPYHQKVKPGTLTGAARVAARAAALDFFQALWDCGIPKIALENPIGAASTSICKPSQIVQPYHFGDDASKATALWLRGLPLLQGTKYVEPRLVCSNPDCGAVFTYGQHKCPECGSQEFKPRWANQTDSGQNRLSPSDERAELRSNTFPGIADAMAFQWG